jgi:hypothetical protein
MVGARAEIIDKLKLDPEMEPQKMDRLRNTVPTSLDYWFLIFRYLHSCTQVQFSIKASLITSKQLLYILYGTAVTVLKMPSTVLSQHIPVADQN